MRSLPLALPARPLPRLAPALQALLLGLLLLLAWDASGLDLLLVRAWGTATGFPWRDHWLTRGLLHEGGRLLAGGLLAFIVAVQWKRMLPALQRRERILWLATALICLALMPVLKRGSLTSCPWDLAEFGGTARYLSHWSWGLADGGAGHCFPSGHASSAFAFLGGYFALRRAYPRAARAWLSTILFLGLLYGWAQMARGAHYASHTLWTGWISWAVCVFFAASFRGSRTRTPARTHDLQGTRTAPGT